MTDQEAAPPAKPPKQKSRPTRWSEAASAALGTLEEMNTLVNELISALDDLKEIQEEYEEWKENLPESLQSSPVAEKLDAICELDIESIGQAVADAIDEAKGQVEEVEGIDLPQGFGRD
jgi:hypothetical protein